MNQGIPVTFIDEYGQAYTATVIYEGRTVYGVVACNYNNMVTVGSDYTGVLTSKQLPDDLLNGCLDKSEIRMLNMVNERETHPDSLIVRQERETHRARMAARKHKKPNMNSKRMRR